MYFLARLFPLFPAILFVLTELPMTVAHGKVISVIGNMGGNGTGLGILGGIVPGAGPNSKTEIDTTVFNTGNGNCGQTTSSGAIKVDLATKKSMTLSGGTLPKISTNNASISGTWLTVTSDGAGPISAFVDPTGAGIFNSGSVLRAPVTLNIPGQNGNIDRDSALQAADQAATKALKAAKLAKGTGRRALQRRATNVDVSSNFTIQMPEGLQCTGKVAGQSNVCMIKIVNPSGAGPFGGCVAVQQTGDKKAT